ncbi:MAG: hypothetical protein WCV56_02830 [Candidatus Omnitrophota bacterium]
MNAKFVLRSVLLVWIILWVIFLARQSKRGQYAELTYLYANEYGSKVRYLLGDDLEDLLAFSAENLPRGATYDITGFERFSIREVRARYYLWPLYRTEDDPEFIISYGDPGTSPPGYKEFKVFPGKGAVYSREEAI